MTASLTELLLYFFSERVIVYFFLEGLTLSVVARERLFAIGGSAYFDVRSEDAFVVTFSMFAFEAYPW